MFLVKNETIKKRKRNGMDKEENKSMMKNNEK